MSKRKTEKTEFAFEGIVIENTFLFLFEALHHLLKADFLAFQKSCGKAAAVL